MKAWWVGLRVHRKRHEAVFLVFWVTLGVVDAACLLFSIAGGGSLATGLWAILTAWSVANVVRLVRALRRPHIWSYRSTWSGGGYDTECIYCGEPKGVTR